MITLKTDLTYHPKRTSVYIFLQKKNVLYDHKPEDCAEFWPLLTDTGRKPLIYINQFISKKKDFDSNLLILVILKKNIVTITNKHTFMLTNVSPTFYISQLPEQNKK